MTVTRICIEPYHNKIEAQYTGLIKKWYSNNNIYVYARYKQGKLHGDYFEFFPDSQPHKYWKYHKDDLHGICKTWHNNGTATIKNYKYGIIIEQREIK